MSKKILVVEDDIDIAKNLAILLNRAGYQTEIAPDGRSALDLLNRNEELPGLILLDLMMPIMDGQQFRQVQREDPRLSDIPVVVMTADANYQSKTAGLGFQAILKKPFLDIGNVISTVNKYCVA